MKKHIHNMKQTLKPIFLLYFSFILIVMIGCQTEPSDPIIIVSIDDEFEVDLWENLAVDVSSLYLNIKTIANVECENTTIEFENEKSPINKIAVTLNGIKRPENCIQAEVPAEGVANIGYLPPGTFSFDINLQGTTVTNSGTLTVSEESYVLRMNSNDGFKLLHGTLMRVPDETIWGVVNFQNAPFVVNTARDFFDEIEANSADKTYSEGYYGYFSINENNEIVADESTAFPNSKHFIFNYKSDVLTLQNRINQIRADFGENIEIKMFTWEGKEL